MKVYLCYRTYIGAIVENLSVHSTREAAEAANVKHKQSWREFEDHRLDNGWGSRTDDEKYMVWDIDEFDLDEPTFWSLSK